LLIIRIVFLATFLISSYVVFAQPLEKSVIEEEDFKSVAGSVVDLDPKVLDVYNRHKEEIGGSDHKLFITNTALENIADNKSFSIYVESRDQNTGDIRYHKITAINDSRITVPWPSGVELVHEVNSIFRQKIIERMRAQTVRYYDMVSTGFHGKGNPIMNGDSLASTIYNRHKEEIPGSDHEVFITDKQQGYVDKNISFSLLVRGIDKNGNGQYHKITAIDDPRIDVPWISGVMPVSEPKQNIDLYVPDWFKILKATANKPTPNATANKPSPGVNNNPVVKNAPKKQRGRYLKSIPGTAGDKEKDMSYEDQMIDDGNRLLQD